MYYKVHLFKYKIWFFLHTHRVVYYQQNLVLRHSIIPKGNSVHITATLPLSPIPRPWQSLIYFLTCGFAFSGNNIEIESDNA